MTQQQSAAQSHPLMLEGKKAEIRTHPELWEEAGESLSFLKVQLRQDHQADLIQMPFSQGGGGPQATAM